MDLKIPDPPRGPLVYFSSPFLQDLPSLVRPSCARADPRENGRKQPPFLQLPRFASANLSEHTLAVGFHQLMEGDPAPSRTSTRHAGRRRRTSPYRWQEAWPVR
jgi:hypothetical protein